MRKLFLLTFLLGILVLPCHALAATVSGTLTQISAHSYRTLEKITIELEAEDGTRVQDATDKDGRYRFTGVSAGRYRISAVLPSDHVPALMGDNNWFLPAQDNHAQTDWFTVSDNMVIDLASTRATVYVKVVAFVDENANGGRMNSEAALSNVQVSLYPAGHPEHLVASGVTDRKGELTLNSLSPGEYRLKAVYPDNYTAGPLGSKISIYYNCIHYSDTQEAWSDPFEVTSGSAGIGIGAVATGNAQGTIWYDANGNGRKDADETGLSGVSVALSLPEEGLTLSAVTDNDGGYLFSRLQPGDYTLRVTAPEGYMFSPEGGDSWLTEGYADTDQGTVTVSAETTARVRSVGLMNATRFKVIFYQDDNANGQQDAHETGYAGAGVTVTRNGRVLATAGSNESGEALIPIIRAGDVQVQVQIADDVILSPTGLDNDFALTVAASSATIDTTLVPGQTNTLYAAVTHPAQIGGQLYLDSNDNGLLDDGETPAEGFTVQAVDWTGQLIATAVTDASGHYLFDHLLPIPHTVRFLLDDPFIAAPTPGLNADGANSIIRQTADYGETDLIQLTPGAFIGGINGALFQAGTVTGRVILPEDRPQGMSAGLEGVTVTLVDAALQPVSEHTVAVSEADGTYYLKGILPGEYQLLYTLPADSLFTDTDELSVTSVPFTAAMGDDIRMADISAIRTATISGQVLCDGVPADATITAVNEALGRTVTFPAESASAGYFALERLRPGEWLVTVTLDEGFSFAEDTALVPAVAQHVSSAAYTLDMGDQLSGQQVTVTRPAAFTGRVFLDDDLSDTYDEGERVFAGLDIALVNRDGETAAELTTDESGCFASPLLVPGVYQLTLALDADTILLNGVQLSKAQWTQEVTAVSGETSDIAVSALQFAAISGRLWSLDDSLDFVAGLEVQLYGESEAPIAVTKTDKTGAYAFDRLYPGEYRLSVDLPEGHGFARRADTGEGRVSLIVSNDEAEMSAPLTLHMGDKYTGADFGFGAKGSIGDFAWLDENGNGMQDIGEPGIPGIVLELWQDGELLAKAETDVYGHYMIESIYPGHYTLRVTMHAELKSTRHQTEFPLIGSVLPESDALTVEAADIVVPSGTRNLAVDVGFALRDAGHYPAVMDTIPTTDWSFGGKKR